MTAQASQLPDTHALSGHYRYDMFLYCMLSEALAFDGWHLLGEIAGGAGPDAPTPDRRMQIGGAASLHIPGHAPSSWHVPSHSAVSRPHTAS